MRGDRPLFARLGPAPIAFTPHARGSTESAKLFLWLCYVYPACAGIDLYDSEQDLRRYCLPRMRGDRPYSRSPYHRGRGFTPHARGSTVRLVQMCYVPVVYPACAGIDLNKRDLLADLERLPRMRGDRPDRVYPLDTRNKFTPHARGSTVFVEAVCRHSCVYPACAGIDRCMVAC